MISETTVENMEFPMEFNNIHPEQYKILLPSILDFLIKAQRSNEKVLYFQTITKINEIVANMSFIVDEKCNDILLTSYDNCEKIALLLLIVNDIKSHKKIVQSKFYLKVDDTNPIQYPLPVTSRLLEILTEKEKFVLKFVDMLD